MTQIKISFATDEKAAYTVVKYTSKCIAKIMCSGIKKWKLNAVYQVWAIIFPKIKSFFCKDTGSASIVLGKTYHSRGPQSCFRCQSRLCKGEWLWGREKKMVCFRRTSLFLHSLLLLVYCKMG